MDISFLSFTSCSVLYHIEELIIRINSATLSRPSPFGCLYVFELFSRKYVLSNWTGRGWIKYYFASPTVITILNTQEVLKFHCFTLANTWYIPESPYFKSFSLCLKPCKCLFTNFHKITPGFLNANKIWLLIQNKTTNYFSFPKEMV